MFSKTLLLVKKRSILCKIKKTRMNNKTSSIQYYFLCYSVLSIDKIIQKKNNERSKEEKKDCHYLQKIVAQIKASKMSSDLLELIRDFNNVSGYTTYKS